VPGTAFPAIDVCEGAATTTNQKNTAALTTKMLTLHSMCVVLYLCGVLLDAGLQMEFVTLQRPAQGPLRLALQTVSSLLPPPAGAWAITALLAAYSNRPSVTCNKGGSDQRRHTAWCFTVGTEPLCLGLVI
jgi:hypothetical protein